MNDGQSCQLNWTVNATGTAGSVWQLDANFFSSISTLVNDTPNAFVCIDNGTSCVTDVTPPNYTQSFVNTTAPFVGRGVKISTRWVDETALAEATLSTNETGIWKNYTGGTHGSPLTLSGTDAWANFSWRNNTIHAGAVIGWRVFVRDGAGNQNVTPIQTFNITPAQLWNYTTGGQVYSSPAIADMDGDGNVDIVWGSWDGGLYSLRGSDNLTTWSGGNKSANFTSRISSSPTLVNLVGGSDLEVVFGAYDNNLYVVNGTNGSVIWNFTTGGRIWASPAVADITGDGIMEILISSNSNRTFALDRNGNQLWNLTSGNAFWSSPVIRDLNGDGVRDVVMVSYDGFAYAINGSNGKQLWNYSFGQWSESSPAIADVNGDGFNDTVFGARDNRLYAINGSDGKQLWNFTAGNWIFTSPVAVNVSSSNYLHVIFGSHDSYIYAINGSNGAQLWNFSISTGGRIESSPAVKDFNRDGILDVIAGSTDGYVYVVNANNGKLQWNMFFGSYFYATPAVDDLNGDGRLDIAIGSIDSRLYVID